MKNNRRESPDRDHPAEPELSETLSGRKLLLAVTGGIAAYKSCYLVRGIVRMGGNVQVIMSDAAKQFIGPLTFATLSGRPVLDHLFPEPPPDKPIHLQTSEWGEILIVAPATADFIGRLAHGIADDMPTTVAIAFQGPILLAPAMNPRMWKSTAVQENVLLLKHRKVHFTGPTIGEMGGFGETTGMGRMVEPDAILDCAKQLLSNISGSSGRTGSSGKDNNGDWRGKTVIVTSGPTRESIDPVRFISNRSSGRMGDSIAIQAYIKGANVILIRGKGAEGPPPSEIHTIEVENAAEMATAVKNHFSNCDLLVMTAAVADWTVDKPSLYKVKKRTGPPLVIWRETEDILAWAGSCKEHQIIIGFALETDNHEEEARRKLIEKGADIIALNDPTQPDSIFGGDTIQLTLVSHGHIEPLPLMSKSEAADRLLETAQHLSPDD